MLLRRNNAIVLSLALLPALATAGAAAADTYRIETGDTIELSAASSPELRTKSTVGMDGGISLPLVGDVRAKGLTASELQEAVRREMVSKVFRRKSSDGRDISIMVAPDEVTVAIVEYRPVYVNGDVSQPGQQPYRPGLTVRQAIALAGGLDVMRFRAQNPLLEEADFRASYDENWTRYAEQQARILRLRAELAGERQIDAASLKETPVSTELADRIVSNANAQLTARNGLYQKEREYLTAAVASEDDRIAALSEQQEKEKAGAEADKKELERVQNLFAQKTLPITRLIDARRTILLSSTRYLQTMAQRGQSERDRAELAAKLAKLVDQRRDAVLAELQTAEVELAATRTRLQAAGDKMIYTGLVRSRLVRGKDAEPSVVIYRKDGADNTQALDVGQDADLRPGDVIDIALQKKLPETSTSSRSLDQKSSRN
jgi:polysaccharide export outer membrane protein